MPNTKSSQILDVACEFIMERGYNGFSFRDIAAEVGIKSASIHYHYPTKADLAVAVASTYRQNFMARLYDVTEQHAVKRLEIYGSLFVHTLKGEGKLCLGGVLAAGAATIPAEVLEQVTLFFEAQNVWVRDTLINGQRQGEIRTDIHPDTYGAMMVSSLQGAMIVARGTNNNDHLENALAQLIALATP